MTTSIGRRAFLKGALASGAIAATGALAGCAPSEKTNAADKADDSVGTSNNGTAQTAETAQREWAFEIPPEPIADDAITEVIEADLVVVGAGTSGLITAVSAAEEGLNVVVVSASEKPVARGGSNNAVFCTAMEREGFEKLTPFMFQKEIFYAGNQVDEAKWYRHYNNSETAMNWVISIMENAGYRVKVEKGTPGSPTSLYYETCSVGWDYGEDMEPNPDIPAGTGMMQPLLVGELARRLTEELGGRIDFKTKGEQLMRDDDGKRAQRPLYWLPATSRPIAI